MLVSDNLWTMCLVGHTGFLNRMYCAFQLCEVVQFVSSSETCVCAAVFSILFSPCGWSFASSFFVHSIMTARQTNNSFEAAFSAVVVSSTLASNVTRSMTSSSIASSLPGKPVVVSSQMVGAASADSELLSALNAVLSPALVALINQAAQAAVQASQRQPDHLIMSSAPCSVAGSSSVSLSGLASSFLAAGTGFQPSITSSSTQGRTIPIVVPTFVSTFNAPVLALVSSPAHAISGIPAQIPSSNVNTLADQPFVVGPRFSRPGQGGIANSKRKIRRFVRT